MDGCTVLLRALSTNYSWRSKVLQKNDILFFRVLGVTVYDYITNLKPSLFCIVFILIDSYQ